VNRRVRAVDPSKEGRGAGLAIEAFVHLDLASSYDGVKSSVLTQGHLFRVEAAPLDRCRTCTTRSDTRRRPPAWAEGIAAVAALVLLVLMRLRSRGTRTATATAAAARASTSRPA